jgi:pimeloyl-ACP methyl ester carboxylesterase
MRLRLSIVAAAVLMCASSAAGAGPTRFIAEVEGTGPDVILIPGLASPAGVWDSTVAQLRDDYRVHVIQVSGFAGAPAADKSEGPVVAPLVEKLAAYIEDEKLEVSAVIGHSLGGAAAVMLASRHPGAVDRIMAVDALPFYALSMNPRATVEWMRPIAEAARAQMLSQTPEQFALAQEVSLRRMIKDEAARTAVFSQAVRSDAGTFAHAVYELMTTDLRSELSKVRAPLTIVYAYDEAYGVPAENIDQLFTSAWAGARDVRFRRIDGSFHFIMLDQPEGFAAAVAEFLK